MELSKTEQEKEDIVTGSSPVSELVHMVKSQRGAIHFKWVRIYKN